MGMGMFQTQKYVCLKNSHPRENDEKTMECSLIWVCLKMVSTPKPNGFADPYPNEKWLFHWEY